MVIKQGKWLGKKKNLVGTLLFSLMLILEFGWNEAIAKNKWSHLKPLYGGLVGSVVIGLDGTLYSISSGGPYKSMDGGLTWSSAVGNASTFGFRIFAVHPTIPGVVYAVTDKGLAKSIDSGVTWNFIGSGFPTQEGVTSLVIDHRNPSILYVSTSGLGAKGILKSTDSGETWVQKNNGLQSLHIGHINVDPNIPNKVVAVSWRGHFYISENGGESWTATQGMWGNVIGIAPSDSNIIYVTHDGDWWSPSGRYPLLKSTDGGSGAI